MRFSEIVEQEIEEGVNDPHIFKAVFMAGGPGSGKSYVASKLLKNTGLRPVNSDTVYEFLMKKAGMDLDPVSIFSPKGQEIRQRAKDITGRQQGGYLDGRIGLVIDGTGKDVAKVEKTKKMLEELGYATMMLFVNTSLEVAQERNQQRERSLEPKVVEKMWNNVQQNIMAFQQVFGAKNFLVVDNSGGLEDPARSKNFKEVERDIQNFLKEKPTRPAATRWIKQQQKAIAREDITQSELNSLESVLDRVFGEIGIDVNFTRHFIDRANDTRNGKSISIRELAALFKKEYQRWGKPIVQMGPDSEAVMKDLETDINVPFVLRWDRDNEELDMIAKTVMRKKNFRTSNKEFPVKEAGGLSMNQIWNDKPVHTMLNKKAYAVALKILKQIWDRKSAENDLHHSAEYYAAQVERQFPEGMINSRTLAGLLRKELEKNEDK